MAWRDNILVAANTSAVDDSFVAKAHWYEFKTDASNPMSIPLVLQTGVIDPGPGVSTFFPAIDINKAGDIGLTYMESSTERIYLDVRDGADQGRPGEHDEARPCWPRPASHPTSRSTAFLLHPYRQGDFAGMGVDPANDSFWAANEYATATQPLANYGTWIQQFTLEPTALNGVYLNLGNSGDGIQLNGVSGAMITGNTISANVGNGINADGGTSGLQVLSNLIGTDPVGDNLGNVGNGIDVLGSQNTISGNTISIQRGRGDPGGRVGQSETRSPPI